MAVKLCCAPLYVLLPLQLHEPCFVHAKCRPRLRTRNLPQAMLPALPKCGAAAMHVPTRKLVVPKRDPRVRGARGEVCHVSMLQPCELVGLHRTSGGKLLRRKPTAGTSQRPLFRRLLRPHHDRHVLAGRTTWT
jgi:hypothetical protein